MSGSGFAPQFQQQYEQQQHQSQSQIVVKPIAKMSSDAIFRKSIESKMKELVSQLEATQKLYSQFFGERFEIDGSDESASVVSYASRKTFTHVGHQMAASLASGPQTPMTNTSPMSPSTSPGMPPASTFFYPQDPQAMQFQAMQQAMQHQQAMQLQQQVILEQQRAMRQQAPAFQPIPQLAAAAPFHYPAAAAAAAPKPYAAAAKAAPKPPAASQKAAEPKAAAKAASQAKLSEAAMEAAIIDGTYAAGGGGGGGGGSPDPAPQAVMGKGKGLSKAERDAVKSKRQIELARVQVQSSPEAQAWIDQIATFIHESNECKKLGDLGQSSNGLAKPAACAALKLKDALMSDERFVVKGDSVGLFEWEGEAEGEGGAQAEAEAEWGDQPEGEAAGDLNEGLIVAQEAQEEEASRTIFSGRIYFKAASYAYISFPAEKDVAHQDLFTGMCDWLKAQKEKGKKEQAVSAFRMIGSEKFGQNLIAYRNESNADDFDALKKLDKVVFYINEKVDNVGDKCFYAVDIIPAE